MGRPKRRLRNTKTLPSNALLKMCPISFCSADTYLQCWVSLQPQVANVGAVASNAARRPHAIRAVRIGHQHHVVNVGLVVNPVMSAVTQFFVSRYSLMGSALCYGR